MQSLVRHANNITKRVHIPPHQIVNLWKDLVEKYGTRILSPCSYLTTNSKFRKRPRNQREVWVELNKYTLRQNNSTLTREEFQILLASEWRKANPLSTDDIAYEVREFENFQFQLIHHNSLFIKRNPHLNGLKTIVYEETKKSDDVK